MCCKTHQPGGCWAIEGSHVNPGMLWRALGKLRQCWPNLAGTGALKGGMKAEEGIGGGERVAPWTGWPGEGGWSIRTDPLSIPGAGSGPVAARTGNCCSMWCRRRAGQWQVGSVLGREGGIRPRRGVQYPMPMQYFCPCPKPLFHLARSKKTHGAGWDFPQGQIP